MIRLKRAYETPLKDDGMRILVERLWPRGLTKERGQIDLWLKDVAPSAELRMWFAHDFNKWDQFRARYEQELVAKSDVVHRLREKTKAGMVTFVYAARDEERNSARVLKEFVEHALGQTLRRRVAHKTRAGTKGKK